MGFSDASAPPEDGKKCWFKVTLDGRSRLIEWNTSKVTFKEMDTKVKKMFGVHDKHRVTYAYIKPECGEILLSSDEELSTALHFLDGEILSVSATIEKKKRKTVFERAARAAKQQSQNLSNAYSRIPALPRDSIWALAAQVRASAQHLAANCCFAQRPRPADPAAPPVQARRPPCRLGARRLTWVLFFLVLALFVAHAKNVVKIKNEWREALHQNYAYKTTHQSYDPHVTILSATYGGRDVTRQVQDYYIAHGKIIASNTIFGDPNHGSRKYLHVVYQHYSTQNGLAEVYTQSFPESYIPASFTMTRDNCAYPEEAIVDGRPVKILGALYEDVSATCAARRFAATGHLSADSYYYSRGVINRNYFGSNSAHGFFTLVYLKNNKMQTFSEREGGRVYF